MATDWSVDACGGYEVIFVERHQEIWYKYMCVICRLIPRSVHQVNCCGKFMCHQCYEKQKRLNGNQCPSCRGRMDGKVFHDTNRQQEILSLQVFCYNKDHGCSWSGELLSLERCHSTVCTYKLVVCHKCGEKVPESIMGTHLADNCRKRAYKCPYCGKTGVFEDIKDKHLDECPECPIDCPNSGRGCVAKMKRKEIEEHRQVCNSELVSCRYQSLGCNIMIIRLEKQRHECMCPYKPVEDISNLNPHQCLRQNVLPLHTCIDKFKSRWENKEVWQQEFFTEHYGYFMCLKVYLNFRDTYLACYIHIKAGPHDESLDWPFKGIFEIELLNQKEDKNHYMKEIKFLTSRTDAYNRRLVNSDECLGLGEPQYMAQCDLTGKFRPNCEYLQEDKVVLRVSVKSADSCNRFWPCGGTR